MSLRRVEDPGGALLRVMDYQGHLVQPFPDLGPRLDSLSELSVRPDDVLVTGYPKTGNHWVWEICLRLLTNNVGPHDANIGQCMLEARDDSYLSEFPSPRVLFTHLPPSIVTRAKQLFSGKHKIVYVLRDPKDVAVSYYIQTYSCRLLYEYDGEWKDYLELFLRGEVDSGSWFDHVLSWEKYKTSHPELPIHFVFYEDLSKDLYGGIRKLASFLELEKDETFLQQLCEATRFAAMKKNHDDHVSQELKALYRDNGEVTMFRKGVAGGWRDTFTNEQSDRLDAVFAERMKDCKLVFPFKTNSP